MWDSGAQHQAKVAKQAEQRFRAREYEQRITREQVGGHARTSQLLKGYNSDRMGCRFICHPVLCHWQGCAWALIQ